MKATTHFKEYHLTHKIEENGINELELNGKRLITFSGDKQWELTVNNSNNKIQTRIWLKHD